jgi:hypothetical protein
MVDYFIFNFNFIDNCLNHIYFTSYITACEVDDNRMATQTLCIPVVQTMHTAAQCHKHFACRRSETISAIRGLILQLEKWKSVNGAHVCSDTAVCICLFANKLLQSTCITPV